MAHERARSPESLTQCCKLFGTVSPQRTCILGCFSKARFAPSASRLSEWRSFLGNGGYYGVFILDVSALSSPSRCIIKR